MAEKKFLPQNFKFITDAKHGWKPVDNNFIRENWFLSIQNLAKLWNIYMYPLKIFGYAVAWEKAIIVHLTYLNSDIASMLH